MQRCLSLQRARFTYAATPSRTMASLEQAVRQAPQPVQRLRVDRVGGRPGDLEGAQPAVDAERAGAVQRNLARVRGRQRRLVLSEHGDLDLAVRLALESFAHAIASGPAPRIASRPRLVGDRLDGDGSGSLAWR